MSTGAGTPGPVLLSGQPLDQRLYGLIGQRYHFVVGPILDRVLDEHALGLETQGLALGLGGIDEYCAGYEYARYASTLKIGDVVHTARRATASIS